MSFATVEVNPAWKPVLTGVTLSLLREKGDEITDLARQYAPVKTGELRDSIDYTIIPRPATLVVYAAAPYAGYVEAGTSRMVAQPFLAPAVQAAGL